MNNLVAKIARRDKILMLNTIYVRLGSESLTYYNIVLSSYHTQPTLYGYHNNNSNNNSDGNSYHVCDTILTSQKTLIFMPIH